MPEKKRKRAQKHRTCAAETTEENNQILNAWIHQEYVCGRLQTNHTISSAELLALQCTVPSMCASEIKKYIKTESTKQYKDKLAVKEDTLQTNSLGGVDGAQRGSIAPTDCCFIWVDLTCSAGKHFKQLFKKYTSEPYMYTTREFTSPFGPKVDPVAPAEVIDQKTYYVVEKTFVEAANMELDSFFTDKRNRKRTQKLRRYGVLQTTTLDHYVIAELCANYDFSE